jgi:hypothetical protein
MTQIIEGCVLFGFFICAACTPTERQSTIVEHAEKAGAGDLRSATSQSIQQWLGRNRQVALEIEEMCKTVRQSTTADWADTTEGRLCAAAHELAFFRSAPARGDGRVFRPGVN